MFRLILLTLTTIFLYSGKALALDTIHPVLMERARSCPATLSTSVTDLTNYLRKGLTDEYSQVEVFCYWIALNIGYDTQAYQQGTDPETSDILKTRKGVCQNYSELLAQMCGIAGIECHIVSGYSKGFDYKPGMIKALYKLYGRNEVPDKIMPMCIHKLGNSSVATIPTLYDLVLNGQLEGHEVNAGDIVLFASVGAGMNINAICYRI